MTVIKTVMLSYKCAGPKRSKSTAQSRGHADLTGFISGYTADLFRISGEYNYLIKAQTASIEALAEFQNTLVKLGPSKSHIALKTILENRVEL